MVSDSTVISDPVQQFEQAFTGRQAMMWTALPGIVTRFNAEALTCEVQPAIKGRHVAEDGSVVVENLPLLLDCPVVFLMRAELQSLSRSRPVMNAWWSSPAGRLTCGGFLEVLSPRRTSNARPQRWVCHPGAVVSENKN